MYLVIILVYSLKVVVIKADDLSDSVQRQIDEYFKERNIIFGFKSIDSVNSFISENLSSLIVEDKTDSIEFITKEKEE